jgi:hypothetical protein
LYPEHSWDLFKFKALPHGYWKEKANQQSFLETIGKKLGVQHLDDWRNISRQQALDHGGSRLLRMYNDSLQNALESIYPQHPWNFVKETKHSYGHWNDISRQRQFFDELLPKLSILFGRYLVRHVLHNTDTTDWNKVTWKQVVDNGGSVILTKYGNSLAKGIMRQCGI